MRAALGKGRAGQSSPDLANFGRALSEDKPQLGRKTFGSRLKL